MRSIIFTAVLIFAASRCGQLGAEQLPSLEEASAKLQSATVTVRVVSATKADDDDELKKSTPDVTVFTGVSLGEGLIVAPLFVTDKMTIRVTMPGGEQAVATPRLLDEPSGLALLSLDKVDLKKVDLAEAMPKVGSWVISAAGWGVEKPVVSFGIVSGVDRRMPGSTFPPLLQCNLTTTESSSGAGVVNTGGQLVGIIIATDAGQQNRGWTYAMPVKHIQRMLRTYESKRKKSDAPVEDHVIITKQRRPVVGMVIGGGLDEVVVRRISNGGPADRAGIKLGDRILAVDGVKIRSPYQAVNPLLYKQPGETVTFLVQQKGGASQRKVVLGGGVEVPLDGEQRLSQLVQPRISINSIVLRNSLRQMGHVAEVFGDGNLKPKEKGVGKLELLERAMESYQTVIKIQQERLSTQQEELREATKLIESLQTQIDQLRRERDADEE